MIGAGIYGAMNVTIAYKQSYFIGSDAYLKDYFDKSEAYFTTGFAVNFYTDGENDYFSKKS